jgi:serine phosphatase RsbU (regulator of sigma subunit)
LVAATHWPYTRAPGRALEAVALALGVLGITYLGFSSSAGYTYLIFPPLIWGALRFWQPGAVAATLLVAGVAIPLTEHGMGPWAGQSPDERLLLAQTFIGIAGLTALVLAAVISERMQAEEDVEELAETLQESLLPADLPKIPRVETAVTFRAAGRGQRVGGDFYDWFECDDGSWAVVVGDVVGKGAAAAATTGLARYTLRAAAFSEPSPQRVLRFLNDAILRESPTQLCTIAYARVAFGARGGARLTMSIGGHPLPLLLRAGGRVEPLGEPGSLLGALQDPSLSEYDTDLEPGDALVLYTDGLTDAYAPDHITSIEELEASVRSCAGRDAMAIMSGIEHSVLHQDGGEPRDDIVILVLRVPPA